MFWAIENNVQKQLTFSAIFYIIQQTSLSGCAVKSKGKKNERERKMHRTKKRLAALLATVLLLTLSLVSCTGDEVSQAASQAESGSGLPVPHLGEADLDGFQLTFVIDSGDSQFHLSQYSAGELLNEPVNDALYERNQIIQNTYNCKIDVLPTVVGYEMMAKIEPMVLASTEDFNVIGSPILYSADFSKKGYYQNFLELENSQLRLDADYWDQGLIRDASVAGTLHFLTGDLLVGDNLALSCIYFNKSLISEYGLQSPFDHVRADTWTFDVFSEYVRNNAHDDGDGVMGVDGNDIWGLIGIPQTLVDVMWGYGLKTTVKDNDDIPHINLRDETFTTRYAEAFELLSDRNSVCIDALFFEWNDPDIKKVYEQFEYGKALFQASTLGYTEDLRDAEISYGIVPFPKYDENQDQYYSPTSVYASGYISIPYYNNDIYETTFILEAMSYLSEKTVTPEFYERTLKNKRLQDDDSPEMLDLISASRTYDLSIIYTWGEFYVENTYNLVAGTNTYTARVDSIYSSMESAMNDTIALFNQ